jgi:hypothetical protein
MDVISFLCVPLGSSTVQLHDSLCGRRASTLISTVKMATVLEVCTTKEVLYVFCGQKKFMYYMHALCVICTYFEKEIKNENL